MTTQEIKDAWKAYRDNNPTACTDETYYIGKFVAFLIQRTQHDEINNPKSTHPNPDITHG